MGIAKKKKSFLGYEQREQLRQWLVAVNAGAAGEKSPLTIDDAIGLVEKDLGLIVTANNVNSVNKVVGVKFTRAKRVYLDTKQKEALGHIKEDSNRLMVLTAAITDIYIKLGEKMPEKLADMKDELSSEMKVLFK